MNLLVFGLGTALALVAANTRTTASVRRTGTILLIGLMLAVPFITRSSSTFFDTLTAMAIAYGWNFIGGYTGYAAFGNVAYLGLGAFVAAGFMSRQPGHLQAPWYVGIPLAVAIVSLVAGLIGLVVLRLRGHYFSIATLGIAVAMPQIINWDLFFGPKGPIKNFFGGGRPLNFPLADSVRLGSLELTPDRFLFYYLSLATALLSVGLTAWLSRGKFGYALVAIRENEEAAGVLGINTTARKIQAYMLSAALAALGGAVIGFRLVNMTTEAEALFSTSNNLQMIIICLIGGAGTVWGPWIGAFVLFGIQEILRTLSSSTVFLQWQAVVFSVMIILVVLFLPRGLVQFVRGRGSGSVLRLIRDNLVAHRV